MIEREFLTVLRCPNTGSLLSLSKDGTKLICQSHQLAYPIQNNIPLLRIEDAFPYTEEAYKDAT